MGTIEVCGGRPAADAAQLAKVGFVAQDTPTYAGLTVADHLRLGAHLNPRWDDAAARRRIDRLAPRPASEGRPALRRPARPAGADARPGEATRAADPRRAGREPGPAGPTRVPAGADGGRRRGRDQRAALLARRLRPRAGLRPRRRPGRLPGPGRRRRRGPARDAPPAVRAASRARHAARPTSTSSGPATPIVSPRTSYARSRRSSIRPGRVTALGLEDLVLAYMEGHGVRGSGRPRAGGAPVIWLTWRQFRTQFIAVYALVAAACVWLAVTGPALARLARRNHGRVRPPHQQRPAALQRRHRRPRGGARGHRDLLGRAVGGPRARDRHLSARLEPVGHPRPLARGEAGLLGARDRGGGRDPHHRDHVVGAPARRRDGQPARKPRPRG